MKLEVGMYFRTKDGLFGKVIKKYEVNGYFKIIVDIRNGFIEKHKEPLFIKHLKKTSYNIIDLIEVGDYVNGSPVCMFKTDEHGRKWIYTDSNYKVGILENEIETILTHEQFENNCFRIGD